MYITNIQKSFTAMHSKFSFFSFITALALLSTVFISSASPFSVYAAQINISTVSNWWPIGESTISGQQPFKGVLNGWKVDNYSMYWSVDGGQQNLMPTNLNNYPHKESIVDVSGWNWKSSGRYGIAFIAKSLSGTEIARTNFVVNITSQLQPATTNPPSTIITPIPIVTTPTPTKLLENEKLFVMPNSNTEKQVADWRFTRPDDAIQLEKLAGKSTAVWFGGWNSDIQAEVNQLVTASTNQLSLPVLVAYNIPGRDCGGYSGGGTSISDYLTWINKIAAGIANRKALVILEPDSVANIDCMPVSDQNTRLSLLAQAVNILKANPSTYVYLDGGNPRWISPDIMAKRLITANVQNANGFALNVSNFITSEENERYGELISTKLQGKHFVIDTSRNGLGPTPDSQWCNPEGRALGSAPSTTASNTLVDAYLWIKTPGESDGNCNGGPSAGVWWPEYALKLAQNTPN